MEKESYGMELKTRSVSVMELPPLGYGNPEAGITYEKSIGENERAQEAAGFVAETIRSRICMKPVDNEDDGCIDGRHATMLLFVTESGDFYEKPADNSNHERMKVAGGGYVTGLAMRIGTGAIGDGIETDLAATAALLHAHSIYCGAHTAAHRTGEATGCGANDRFDKGIAAGVEYQAEIAKTTGALLSLAGINYDRAIHESVTENWHRALEKGSYFDSSTGKSRLCVIENALVDAQKESGKAEPVGVVKELSGRHREAFIVVNYCEGETFSQNKLGSLMGERFPDLAPEDRPQVFVVDVPRIIALSKAFDKDEQEQMKALYAGIEYQLATAADLTDGSLRTFIVE